MLSGWRALQLMRGVVRLKRTASSQRARRGGARGAFPGALEKLRRGVAEKGGDSGTTPPTVLRVAGAQVPGGPAQRRGCPPPQPRSVGGHGAPVGFLVLERARLAPEGEVSPGQVY